MDLARLADKSQFAFVDGLSELFYAPAAAPSNPAVPAASTPSTRPVPPRTVLPVRSAPSAAGRAPAAPTQPVPGTGNGVNRAATEIWPAKRLHLTGQGTAALDALEKDIQDVVEQLKTTPGEDEAETSDVLLIVDQPDLLLAATGPGQGIGATEMGEWIMGLQQVSTDTLHTLDFDMR